MTLDLVLVLIMEMLKKNNLMKGKPHRTLEKMKYLNEKLERLVEE